MRVDFGRLMHGLALVHGEREALVNVERGRRYTYAQYHKLTNKIANMLGASLGLGEGDKFLLILENDNLSLLQFPTYLKQKAVAAMANRRDAIDEHARQVELIGPKAAFIETVLVASHAEMLRQAGCAVIAMDPLDDDLCARFPYVLQFWELVDAASDAEAGVEVDVDRDIVLLRFTGGTTGRGKCASYTLANWFGGRDSCLMNVDMGFDADTRFLHAAPLSHGTQLFFMPTLFTGGASITINGLDLATVIDLIQAEGITHSFLVPTILYRMLESQRKTPRKLGSLRTLIYGAAPISPDRLNELVECFGSIFVQAYAATEAVCVVCCLEKQAHSTRTAEEAKRLSSAGRLTPGVEVVITDEAGRELPIGETGEIRIRSRAVIPGYFANPEATASEFVNGFWRSGDLGCIDEKGFLYIVDRLKDMIISGGFNVYAGEVEVALATHPAVLNAAVVGLPHPDWGEAVHAEVQLREGCTADELEIIAYMKARIGGYKAPKSVSFTDALPLSPVGKVLRRQVRDRVRQQREAHDENDTKGNKP
ncbi:MAG: AMP-binding protein [Pseudoxanthomonas sp.]